MFGFMRDGFIRDFDDDPFFSGHMQRMDPFMDPFGMFAPRQQRQNANNALMPFGFGNSLFSMNSMFDRMGQMSQDPNCHSFSSSSVMTYTTDQTGRPQVYKASSSTRCAPGGVKETRQSMEDSRSGMQQLSIGHHLHEQGHVVEKKRNQFTGEQEENEELINIEDDDADRFNREWQQRTQAFNHQPAMINFADRHHQARSASPELLALTDGANEASTSGGKKKTGKHTPKRRHHGHKESKSRPGPYQ